MIPLFSLKRAETYAKKILMNDLRKYDTQQIAEEPVVYVNGSSFGLTYESKKTLTSWIPQSAKQ